MKKISSDATSANSARQNLLHSPAGKPPLRGCSHLIFKKLSVGLREIISFEMISQIPRARPQLDRGKNFPNPKGTFLPGL